MAFYTYGETAYNGVTLYLIRTAGSNIRLADINGISLDKAPYYGINGGFFDFSTRLMASIAVQNDVSVGSGQVQDKRYGYGWTNAKTRGTMLYDGQTNTLRVVVADSAGDSTIPIGNRSNYWLAGGVSMSLNDDNNWYQIATNENLPGHSTTATSQRAALVYGDSDVWLVVTPNAVTTTAFREAIKLKVATASSRRDAIFLDGSGSAQMRCTERVYKGSDSTPRPLEGIIALAAK